MCFSEPDWGSSMAKFRAKQMDQIEWLAFSQVYQMVFQMLGSTKEVALFYAPMPGGASLALIPSHRANVVEAASPGGWHDTDDTSGHNWRLVAGHADSATNFGVLLDARPTRP